MKLARHLVVLLGVTGGACVVQDAVPGPPYDVIVLDRVDGVTDNGRSVFALQHRSLETVTNFSRLESPTFRLFQGGTLAVAREDDGDEITSGTITGGQDPDLRYVVEDGTAVPRDDATLFMFSVAYQFEHVLPALVPASAPDVGTLFATRAPMDIIFGHQVLVTLSSGVTISMREQTNAFFNPVAWQFGVERTSAFERIPLGTDSRIIAHELGHAVFQTVFFGGQHVRCDPAEATAHAADVWFPGRLGIELVIDGLNEGFADWMSFATTGGTNPLESANLPPLIGVDLNQLRVLTEDNFRWSQILKMEGIQFDPGCFGMYCLGTLFARSLVATYLAQGHAITDQEARHEFSRAVVAALRETPGRMQTIGIPLPTAEIARCEGRGLTSSIVDPPIIGAFMEAFLEGLPSDRSTLLCDQLAQRFEDGFPVAFRKRCTP